MKRLLTAQWLRTCFVCQTPFYAAYRNTGSPVVLEPCLKSEDDARNLKSKILETLFSLVVSVTVTCSGQSHVCPSRILRISFGGLATMDGFPQTSVSSGHTYR